MFKNLALSIGSFLIMSSASALAATSENPENTLYLKLDTGATVTIQLTEDLAPKHADRLRTLAREGFYNGVVFHRVIDGFMAQTGDPTGTGMGGSDKPDLPAEFSDYQYKRGTVGMARTQDPNSANSQFFICFTDTGCGFLTGQYTVVGQVTEGMSEIDKVSRGEPPAEPSKIDTIVVAADAMSNNAAEPAAGQEDTIDPEQAADLEEINNEETQPTE